MTSRSSELLVSDESAPVERLLEPDLAEAKTETSEVAPLTSVPVAAPQSTLTPPDEDLARSMVAYQAGDGAAFEDIYHRLRAPLGRYLQSLTLDAAQAEDLLQETFLQMHRSRHTYLGPRVKPWAFGIARHVFLMARRSLTRRRRHEVDEMDGLPEIEVAGTPWQSFPERDGLRRSLARLPVSRREPLLLHHVWGFSFREIAGMLGLREVTAKVRSHRGLADLRQMLGGGR